MDEICELNLADRQQARQRRAEVDAAQAEVEALPEPPPEAAIGAVYASGEVSAWQS